MSSWTCGSCSTVNGPNAGRCEVCGLARGVTDPTEQSVPVVPLVPMASIGGPNDTGSDSGPATPAQSAPVPPGPLTTEGSRGRRKVVVALVAAVLVLVAVGIAIVQGLDTNDETAATSTSLDGAVDDSPVTEADDHNQEQSNRSGDQDDLETGSSSEDRDQETELDPIRAEPDPPVAEVPTVEWGPVAHVQPIDVRASCQSASGEDASGITQSYEPARAVDGDPETTWRCDGDAVGATLTLTFDEPVRVTEVSVIPGFAKVDPHDGADRFRQNRRVSQARIVTDEASTEVTFRTDDRTPQPTAIDQVTSSVEIVVDRTVSGSAVQNHQGTTLEARDLTPISEVVVRGHRPR